VHIVVKNIENIKQKNIKSISEKQSGTIGYTPSHSGTNPSYLVHISFKSPQ
jgi:hypothetical protein